MYRGRSFSRYSVERYRWPSGYGYQRWGIGYRLPRDFWISDYYIYDYADYGLGPAPGGFQWIRYGPDILLINLYTGQIADAVYGAFDEDGGPGY